MASTPVGLFVKLKADASDFNSGVLSAAKVVEKATLDITKSLGGVGAVAAGAGLAIVGAAGAAGVALYQLGAQFDSAYDTIRARTGATGEELQKLEGNFKNVYKTVTASTEETANVVGGLRQHFQDLNGTNLENVSRQIIELSQLTKTDLNQNVQEASTLFSAFNIKAGEMSHALDAIYTVVQKTGIPLNELMETAHDFQGTFENLGFTFEETIALLGRFHQAGVTAGQALPALRIAVNNLAAPSDAASAALEKLLGPQVLEKFMKMPIPERFKLVSEKFLELVKAGQNPVDLATAIFGRRGGAEVLNAIKLGAFDIADLTTAMNLNQDAIHKNKLATEDFSEKFTKAWHRIQVALEPIASGVFDKVNEFLEDLIGTADQPVWNTLKNRWEPVSGPTWFQQLSDWWDEHHGIFDAWINVLTTLVGVLIWVDTMFVQFYLSIITGLILIQNWFIDVSDTIAGVFADAWNRIVDVVGGIYGWIITATDTFVGWWQDAWNRVADIASLVWNFILAVTVGVWNLIQAFLFGGLAFLQATWDLIWNTILAVAMFIWNTIMATIMFVWNTIFAFLSAGLAFFSSLWDLTWNAIYNTVSFVWNLITGAISGAWSFIRDTILQPLIDFVQGPLSAAWTFFYDTVQSVWNGIKAVIGQVLRPIGDAVGVFLDGLGFVADLIGKGGGIKDAAQKAYGWGEGLARGGTIGAGFLTNGPMAVVGEGNRAWPEFVIPTDPKYRANAMTLFSALGASLMQQGGTLPLPGMEPMAEARRRGNTSPGSLFGMDVGGLGDLGGGGGLVGDVLRGVTHWVFDAFVDWIKDKVLSALGTSTSPANAARGLTGPLHLVELFFDPAGGPFRIGGHMDHVHAASTEGWQAIQAYLLGLGIRAVPTSTTGGRHVAGSYHYRGMAVDYGDSANDVWAIFRALAATLGMARGGILGLQGGGIAEGIISRMLPDEGFYRWHLNRLKNEAGASLFWDIANWDTAAGAPGNVWGDYLAQMAMYGLDPTRPLSGGAKELWNRIHLWDWTAAHGERVWGDWAYQMGLTGAPSWHWENWEAWQRTVPGSDFFTGNMADYYWDGSQWVPIYGSQPWVDWINASVGHVPSWHFEWANEGPGHGMVFSQRGGIMSADSGRALLRPGWNAVYNGLNRMEELSAAGPDSSALDRAAARIEEAAQYLIDVTHQDVPPSRDILRRR